MRGLITVTIALAGLAAHAAAFTAPPSLQRKSLSFGPRLPHARFETSPPLTTGFSSVAHAVPYDVAHEFLRKYEDPVAGRAYVIRLDSYTDRTTGVSHIYARQVIGGIEVADGNINLNIKNGRVISFGDSVGSLLLTFALAQRLLVLPRPRTSLRSTARRDLSPPTCTLL